MPATLSVETENDRHCIVVREQDGTCLTRIYGTYDELHTMVLDLDYTLKPTTDELNEVRRRVWDAVMIDIAAEVSQWPDDAKTDDDGTPLIDKIHRIEFGDCDEWDNGWFPSSSVRLYETGGENLSCLAEDVCIGGLDDSSLYSDLRLLTDMHDAQDFPRDWEFTLTKPDGA